MPAGAFWVGSFFRKYYIIIPLLAHIFPVFPVAMCIGNGNEAAAHVCDMLVERGVFLEISINYPFLAKCRVDRYGIFD